MVARGEEAVVVARASQGEEAMVVVARVEAAAATATAAYGCGAYGRGDGGCGGYGCETPLTAYGRGDGGCGAYGCETPFEASGVDWTPSPSCERGIQWCTPLLSPEATWILGAGVRLAELLVERAKESADGAQWTWARSSAAARRQKGDRQRSTVLTRFPLPPRLAVHPHGSAATRSMAGIARAVPVWASRAVAVRVAPRRIPPEEAR